MSIELNVISKKSNTPRLLRGILFLWATSVVTLSWAQNPKAISLFNEAKFDMERGHFSLALDKFLKLQEMDPRYPKITDYIQKSSLGLEGEMQRLDRESALANARSTIQTRDKVSSELKRYATISVSKDGLDEVIQLRDDVLFVPGTAKFRENTERIVYLIVKYAELLGNMDIEIRMDLYRKNTKKDVQSFGKKTALVREFVRMRYPKENITLRVADVSDRSPGRSPDDYLVFTLRNYDRKLSEEVLAMSDVSKLKRASSAFVDLKLTANKPSFRPGDGENVDIGLEVKSGMDLRSWVFAIVDISYYGVPVTSFKEIEPYQFVALYRGNESVSEKISWDGTFDDGRGVVRPGQYQLFLEVTDNIIGAIYHPDNVIIEVNPPKKVPVRKMADDVEEVVRSAKPQKVPKALTRIKEKEEDEDGPKIRNSKVSIVIRFGDNSTDVRDMEQLRIQQVYNTYKLYSEHKFVIESYALPTEENAVNIAKNRMEGIVKLLKDNYGLTSAQIKSSSYKIIKPGDKNQLPRTEISLVKD